MLVDTDVFLPRVVELATLSSNRQTKIAACELLHALVIYMIGRDAQVNLGHCEVKGQMDSLYRKIFPAVFQLVCDIELVTLELLQHMYTPLSVASRSFLSCATNNVGICSTLRRVASLSMQTASISAIFVRHVLSRTV